MITEPFGTTKWPGGAHGSCPPPAPPEPGSTVRTMTFGAVVKIDELVAYDTVEMRGGLQGHGVARSGLYARPLASIATGVTTGVSGDFRESPTEPARWLAVRTPRMPDRPAPSPRSSDADWSGNAFPIAR